MDQLLCLKLVLGGVGAGVMILELVATRILAPYLGSSLYVWTSVIGVILAGIAGGGLLGGRLADSYPRRRLVSSILLAASASLCIMAVCADILLRWTGKSFTDLRVASLISAAILFAPPAILLGAVFPAVLRLGLHELTRVGRVSGGLSAWSTAGSLLGTLVTGFFLWHFLGSFGTLLCLSLFLLLLACVLELTRPWVGVSCMALIVVASLLELHRRETLRESGIVEYETAYARYRILDKNDPHTGRPMRLLATSPVGNQSGIFLDRENGAPTHVRTPFEQLENKFGSHPDLPLAYLRYFDLAVPLCQQQERVLLIGGGAFSYPSHYVKAAPTVSLDVVEIDPELVSIARQYFGFNDHARVHTIHDDGRRYINNTERRYDVILIDAFDGGHSIPPHLNTREAVEGFQRVLHNDGVLMLNFMARLSTSDSSPVRALFTTYASVFKSVYLFAVESREVKNLFQNIVLFASQRDLREGILALDATFPNLSEHMLTVEPSYVLTDNFAILDVLLARDFLRL